MTGSLLAGQDGDGPVSRPRSQEWGHLAAHDLLHDQLALVMDRAYQGDEIRQIAVETGF